MHAWEIKRVVVYLLLIVAPIVCGRIVLGACFIVQYFVSFLALHASVWLRNRLLPGAMWMLLFFTTSSQYLWCAIVTFHGI